MAAVEIYIVIYVKHKICYHVTTKSLYANLVDCEHLKI